MAVDKYRSGYKTHILISLREAKNRGDIDEFNIQWCISRGFLSSTGFWGTDVDHRTASVKVEVVFPEKPAPDENFGVGKKPSACQLDQPRSTNPASGRKVAVGLGKAQAQAIRAVYPSLGMVTKGY